MIFKKFYVNFQDFLHFWILVFKYYLPFLFLVLIHIIVSNFLILLQIELLFLQFLLLIHLSFIVWNRSYFNALEEIDCNFFDIRYSIALEPIFLGFSVLNTIFTYELLFTNLKFILWNLSSRLHYFVLIRSFFLLKLKFYALFHLILEYFHILYCQIPVFLKIFIFHNLFIFLLLFLPAKKFFLYVL